MGKPVKKYRVAVGCIVTATSDKKVEKLIDHLWDAIQSQDYCAEGKLTSEYEEITDE